MLLPMGKSLYFLIIYGVTLLALANGAQDLASSIVAAGANEASDVSRNPIYLGMGALIGAAAVITMVITSVITIRGSRNAIIRVAYMK